MTKEQEKIKKRRSAIAAILFFTLVLGTTYVLAAPTAPVSITNDGSSRRDLSGIPDQSVEAQAGNVTALTIDALSVTRFWQGFYGNITGTITLDDANNNTMYNWSIATPQGEVYATRNSSVSFTSVSCANAGNITAEGTAIGQTGSEADYISNTFNQQSHPQFSVGTTTITANTCNSTNTYVNDAAQSSNFYEVLLTDSAGVFIYATIIDADTTGFDGGTYDFQMLVGEDGTDSATTPYYFYVELN
ncbi:hypothetical protein D6783_05840 [Candidatus Woesearchaeota archaeon]|nr:MAG: hypothetical protein D6783_05840 [Candidatus Woesearchaeota archaeon]